MNKFNNYKNIYTLVSKVNNIKSYSRLNNNIKCINNSINHKSTINKINIININSINNSKLNQRYFTSYNSNNNNSSSSIKNLSVHEIIKVYNSFIDSFDSYNNNKQSQSIPILLNELYNIQKTIIKSGTQDIKQLTYDDRLLYGGLFWELDKINSYILSNYNSDSDKSIQLPSNKINIDDVEGIWNIVNIENELIKEPYTIFDLIKTQISSIIHNKEFRCIASKSIQRLVKEFKLLSKERVDETVKHNVDTIKLYIRIATNLGLWQEMIYLRELIKVNNNSDEVLTGISGGAGQYDLEFSEDDLDIVYKIVTCNSTISKYLQPNNFIDINNYQPLKDDQLTSAYDLKSIGKKSLVLVKVDSKGNQQLAQSPSKLLSLNQDKLNKETGYYNDDISNVTSMIILGRVVKLVVDVGIIKNLIHIGIMNEDFTKCILYGSINNSKGDYCASTLNLNVSTSTISESTKSIQLEGDQKLNVLYPDGESLHYMLKTKLNFETNSTNNLF